jgi:DNA-directed RNA polymerase subunit H (RpoH/RPB5)
MGEREFKTFVNALKMMNYRGFTHLRVLGPQNSPDEPERIDEYLKTLAFDTFDLNLSAAPIVVTKDGANPVHIFWKGDIKVDDVRDLLSTKEMKHGIIIYSGKITSYGQNAIKSIRTEKKIETFHEDELQFSLVEHKDVPRHIICSNATKTQVSEKYKVDISVQSPQIPQIKSTDPVCKYLGAVKGQLLKIVRPSEAIPFVQTSENERKDLYDISYRVVV